MSNAEATVPAWSATNAIAGYEDNCGEAVTATLTGTETTGTDCDWTVTYTYTVLDECLNELTGQTYTHSGSDQTAPTLTGTAYTDATDYDACMSNAEATVPAWSATNAIAGYEDNCGVAVTATLTGTEQQEQIVIAVTYTYTVLDECLNELTGQTYTHSGSDQTAPTLTGTAYTDATDYDACMANAEATVPAWSATNAIAGYEDNCGVAVTATLTGTETTGTDCDWTVTYTYTVLDECLNELTGQTYTHSGSDQTAPTLTGTAYTDATDYDACMVNAEATVPAWSATNAIARLQLEIIVVLQLQ